MKKKDEITNPQSCLTKADPEEMLFVLLARDIAAPSTIRFWAKQRVQLGLNEDNDAKIVEALACATAMETQHSKGDFL
jgi:hypothetical protein